jgi:uncharacterized protein
MEQRLSMITLGVRDMTRARTFYESGLGWRRDAGEGDVAFYQVGGVILSLFEWDKLAEDAGLPAAGSGFRGATVAFCTRSKEEVELVIAQADRAGAKVLVSPRDAFWGGYHAYFADPDGHLWEVAYNPFLTITADKQHLLEPPA